MDEANKQLYQLKQQQSSSRVDQFTQTSQSNSCSCNCTNHSKPTNQDPDDLEALKKYHEDLEGTVSQLEVCSYQSFYFSFCNYMLPVFKIASR